VSPSSMSMILYTIIAPTIHSTNKSTVVMMYLLSDTGRVGGRSL
jgi:hypothetical protein